jgi:hypothetical protein
MSYIKQKSEILLVVIILTSFITISCGNYREFTLKNIVPQASAGTNFSLEYPSRYKSLIVNQASLNTTIVTGSFPSESHDSYEYNNLPQYKLWISALKISDKTVEHYKALIEEDLRVIEGQNEFKLIDRSPVNVDEVIAEQVIYSYILQSDKELEDTNFISYRVYFEKNGFFWKIIIEAISDRTEQAKRDFEHIIQTFRIIE